jgi:hypothetical protein
LANESGSNKKVHYCGSETSIQENFNKTENTMKLENLAESKN